MFTVYKSDYDNSFCTARIAILCSSGKSVVSAGVASQIRQYFEDPSFYATVCQAVYNCSAYSPRGATVKAMLIHSGEPMDTYYTANRDTTEPTAELGPPPDYYQGFGRVSLQNVMPYPGIESVTDLYVDEMSIDPLHEVSYTLTVSDATRPVKATLVWMDPPNSIVSAKMLINDIDLKITLPSGVVMYGNGVAGDEINNVEQVSIPQPEPGVYVITATAKVFPNGEAQLATVIITSADGTVSNRVVTPVDMDSAYNSLDCPSNQQMLTVRKMDRGADGWGEGNLYTILDTDMNVVANGTMSSSVPGDVIGYDVFCLDQGSYNVQLVMGGDDSDEMGVDIPQCGIYLSEYQTSAYMDLSSASACNVCAGYELDLMLGGSIYGVPYGWKGDSQYSLETYALDTDAIELWEGTLVTGITAEHKICITTDSTYELMLTGVPGDDDFFDDDYMGQLFGVEEYRVGVYNCDAAADIIEDDDVGLYPYVGVPPNTPLYVTVVGNTCTVFVTNPINPKSDSNDDDDGLGPGETAGIVVGVVAFMALLGAVGWYVINGRKKSAIQEPIL
mmetsp:Transcript_6383/g.9629  ORF Transcript_6383/g.9629 Transcript_6383/m.9629 type:complete len:560 (-) Transcript_6383:78-1757(-)